MRPKWPRSRAAEQRDELAPLHCRMPPVLSTKRNSTPRSGRRLLGCGISAGPWVKLRSHVSEMARPLYLQQRTYLMTVDGRYVPILLQKSFCTRDQNFFWLYRRLPCKYVGDLIVRRKTRWRPR